MGIIEIGGGGGDLEKTNVMQGRDGGQKSADLPPLTFLLEHPLIKLFDDHKSDILLCSSMVFKLKAV